MSLKLRKKLIIVPLFLAILVLSFIYIGDISCVEALGAVEEQEDSLSTIAADEILVGLFASGYDPQVVEDFIKEQKQCQYVLPKVKEYMNIRAEASATSELIGRFKVKNYGIILERGEEFTKIKSGDIVGYVSNKYLYFDEEVWKLLDKWNAYKVKVTANRLYLRQSPEDGKILYTSSKGEVFDYIPSQSTSKWYAVEYKGKVAYMSAKYCETYVTLNTAITMEQVKAEEEAARLAKIMEESKKNKPAIVNRTPLNLSDEDLYLMAAVVYMEARGESYEGQLAVANVIINRMLDGYWGETVSDIVYYNNAFSGVKKGLLDKALVKVANNEECKKAAVEAAAGHNNIGDFKYFITTAKAKYDKYIKYHIIGNHCFYDRKW